MQHTVRMRLILALSKSVAQRYYSDVEVWTLRVFLFSVLPRSLSSRLRLCLFTVWGRMNHWTCWDQWETGQVLRLCEKIVSSFTALMWCPVCQSPEGALRRARSLRRISLQSVLRSDIVWNVKKYVALQRPDNRLAIPSLPTLRTPYTSQLHRRAEKRNHFSFMNKSLNTQCNLTKFSTLIVSEYYRRCYLFNFWNLHYFPPLSLQKVWQNIMSLSITMVFTEEDRFVIKFLRQNKATALSAW